MHKFMIDMFKGIKSFLEFFKIVCIFNVILLLLYWIQNLTNADWVWMRFLNPLFNSLVSLSGNISTYSFDCWGATFEIKYVIAILIVMVFFAIFNIMIALVKSIENIYLSTRLVCRKNEENRMNDMFRKQIEAQESRINKYVVTIHTQPKAKFSHKELNIDLAEQNRLMNEFITKRLSIAPEFIDGGFLYRFNNFANIDEVLDVFFKVLNSSAPIDYAICIQAGDNEEQLRKIISLKYFRKIVMAADTAYRYRFNKTHRYATSQVGIFQYGNGTLELHEFREIS